MLAAVNYLYKNSFRVLPTDIGKVAVVSEKLGSAALGCRIAYRRLCKGIGIEGDAGAGRAVPYADVNPLGIHPVHRIAKLYEAAGAGADVQQRKSAHLALVFAVVSEAAAVCRRK